MLITNFIWCGTSFLWKWCSWWIKIIFCGWTWRYKQNIYILPYFHWHSIERWNCSYDGIIRNHNLVTSKKVNYPFMIKKTLFLVDEAFTCNISIKSGTFELITHVKIHYMAWMSNGISPRCWNGGLVNKKCHIFYAFHLPR